MQVITETNGEDVVLDGYESGGSKVNLNKASQTELETLQGVGPSTAMKIIEHREKKGKFHSIEELLDIPGIGESKFEAIKDNVEV